VKIELMVNGALRVVETHPMTRLLDLLRDDMNLKGCREGCGEGECGACAVIMDDCLVNACMIPSVQAAGSWILTVEGLGAPENPDTLQRAFVEEGAVHCGFCTPGMILAARALLQRNANPSREEVRVALSGTLCRCTGYNRIYAAVDRAVKNGYNPSGDRSCEDSPTGRPNFSDAEKNLFFSPGTLDEALRILGDHPDLLLLAGGTDTGPDVKNGNLNISEAMDIFGLKELRGIERRGSEIRIGGCVTDAELGESAVVAEYLPALREAALLSAGPAVRNRATIGGNLCTASGAADLPVALLALAGKVRLQSRKGQRVLPVEAFIKDYRKTDLRRGEILREIAVPISAGTQKFYKRGSRAALTLSRASLALFADVESGVVREFRAAAGSMSPIPTRLPKLEAALTGQALTPALIDRAVETITDELNPRKSAEYRKALGGNLVRRFLEAL
jgi:carbon-monoxide dehydrogenase small subunit/xanthine dehydrogenase small subunit